METFNDLDRKSKMSMMNNRLNKLLEHAQKENGLPSEKITNTVNFYVNNVDQLPTIGKRRAGKFVVGKEFKLMYGLTDSETEQFTSSLNDRLKGSGVMKKLIETPEVENNG